MCMCETLLHYGVSEKNYNSTRGLFGITLTILLRTEIVSSNMRLNYPNSILIIDTFYFFSKTLTNRNHTPLNFIFEPLKKCISVSYIFIFVLLRDLYYEIYESSVYFLEFYDLRQRFSWFLMIFAIFRNPLKTLSTQIAAF